MVWVIYSVDVYMSERKIDRLREREREREGETEYNLCLLFV